MKLLFVGGNNNLIKLNHVISSEAKQVFDDLVNGFIPNIYFEGKAIFNEILQNDVYYVTQDLPLYLDSLKLIDDEWRNPREWYKKVIVNIAKSGFFDIQRTIEDYCERVWNVYDVIIH